MIRSASRRIRAGLSSLGKSSTPYPIGDGRRRLSGTACAGARHAIVRQPASTRPPSSRLIISPRLLRITLAPSRITGYVSMTTLTRKQLAGLLHAATGNMAKPATAEVGLARLDKLLQARGIDGERTAGRGRHPRPLRRRRGHARGHLGRAARPRAQARGAGRPTLAHHRQRPHRGGAGRHRGGTGGQAGDRHPAQAAQAGAGRHQGRQGRGQAQGG